DEESLLLLSSGHVAFLERPTPSEISFYRQEIKRGSYFEIIMNKVKEIISLHKIKGPKPALSFAKSLRLIEGNYQPTVIPSQEIATDVFNKGRKDSKRVSQCFNRAHVWSYEWDHKHHIQTAKVW